jgi:hypothetical protein
MSKHNQYADGFLPSVNETSKKYKCTDSFAETNENPFSNILKNASPINEKDQGVQGSVFKCTWKDELAVMKISNHVDFVLELEEEAWNRLKRLNCLHFCEIFEKIPIKAGDRNYCLFYKEITNSGGRNDTLANFIYEQNHHPIAIFNCVRQTLAAMIMFETFGITHYDLHADNAMITDTPYDVHVYKFGEHIFPIRTYGLAPVIIDFGLAYIPNSRYNASCVFAKDGFTTYMPDPLVDSRLLLMTSIKDLKKLVKSFRACARKLVNSKYKDACVVIEKFIKMTELIFTPLRLQDNGWYKKDGMFPSIVDQLIDQLPPSVKQAKRGIFKPENFDWIIELLQHEVTIPVTEYKPDTPPFNKATCILAIDWIKYVEPVFRNTYEEQVFFKDLVSIPHDAEIDTYTIMRHRYPKIKNINKLRKKIKNIGDALSNFIYEKTIETERIKEAMYSKLVYKTTKDILHALPSMPNKYTDGMSILVMDPSSPNHKEVVINENLANMLNENEQETLAKYIL